METKTGRQKLNRIKAVLAETGHTGKWLAEQLGKDPVTVSKWCTNTSQPDLYTLNEISNILSLDMRDLLVRREKMAFIESI
ncbi:MAG: helix-turn-helix transcriptional regulator [Bacteroides sp.]|nr:helix-turn-helix transcriptional regulator [Bacteroides sp.]